MATKITSKTFKDRVAMSKDFYVGAERRFTHFKEAYTEEGVPENEIIQYIEYFPQTTYSEIVDELATLIPRSFTISKEDDDNVEFIKKNLFTRLNFLGRQIEFDREVILTGRCFIELKSSPSDDKDVMEDLHFERIPFSKIDDFAQDPITGKLQVVIFEEEARVFNPSNNEFEDMKVKKTYTMENITIEYLSGDDSLVEGMPSGTVPNPFGKYGVFPVLMYEAPKDVDGEYPEIYSEKFLEKQNQFDYLATDISENIHRSVFNMHIIEDSTRDYDDMQVGAGAIWSLRKGEKYKKVDFNLNLLELTPYLEKEEDKMYRSAGLIPPTLRKNVFSTDSKGVLKLADARYIEYAKNVLQNKKTHLDTVMRLYLMMNGKANEDSAKDYSVMLPEDVLPVDVENIINICAVALQAGIWDYEYIYDRYFTDITPEVQRRIEAEREKLLALQVDNANIDNNAKVQGNKAQATSKKDTTATVNKD